MPMTELVVPFPQQWGIELWGFQTGGDFGHVVVSVLILNLVKNLNLQSWYGMLLVCVNQF